MQEWEKYGTCAESLFGGQYQYFHAALSLRRKVDMLQILGNAGIHPNGSFYKMTSGNKQLYQIILCVDTDGTKITDYLGSPRSNTGHCPEKIKFPPLK
ncbi:extracellular ribonuclease LE-like [Argentina anserina]|uniref:extracellular ribonuclease LE-like n=1 Tax=Argentina anserina TaxID=57926 RepID=UPI0021764956|nr:extracellular ribonuclease LE-like [Potentilla anserina]